MTKNLIDTWISAQDYDVESSEYDGLSWAIDELFELAHNDPQRLLSIVIEILKVDSSEKTTGALGAGALEDMLVHHGDDCIDRVIELSNSNEKLRACFYFTFLDKDDVSATVYEKFQSLRTKSP